MYQENKKIINFTHSECDLKYMTVTSKKYDLSGSVPTLFIWKINIVYYLIFYMHCLVIPHQISEFQIINLCFNCNYFFK